MRSLLLCLILICSTSWSQNLVFKGEFAQVSSSSTFPCSTIFGELAYQTRFFYLESRRTAIVHFDHTSNEAFFRGLSLYGLLGYANDIQIDKTFKKDGLEYYVLADGLVSQDLLLMDVKVRVRDESGRDVCNVSAEYSGFPE